MSPLAVFLLPSNSMLGDISGISNFMLGDMTRETPGVSVPHLQTAPSSEAGHQTRIWLPPDQPNYTSLWADAALVEALEGLHAVTDPH